MSKTWLVFENGSYYSVRCSLHSAPKGNPKPVDAYLFTEPEGDFTIAARKAAHAVFTCAEKRGLYKNNGPVIAGFDLSERIKLDTSLTGQSGGLCFAVCFAGKLLKTDTGNIAATGIIEADGKIGRVKGIETKLKTSAGLVKDQGIILFPEKNLPDISPDLKSLLKEKKIKTFPVADMKQVFDILFEKEEPLSDKKSIPKKSLFLTAFILATLIFAALFFARPSWLYFFDAKRTNKVSTIEMEKQEIKLKPETESIVPLKIKIPKPLTNDHIKSSANNNKHSLIDDKGFE